MRAMEVLFELLYHYVDTQRQVQVRHRWVKFLTESTNAMGTVYVRMRMSVRLKEARTPTEHHSEFFMRESEPV